MTDFATQFKQQADMARQQYDAVMQNLQTQAKQYQDSLRMPNLYTQPQPQPQYQPPIPPQLPVFPQQPQPEAASDTPPYTLQILAVLGDIKGILSRVYPEPVEPEAKEEAIVEKPVKTAANDTPKK